MRRARRNRADPTRRAQICNRLRSCAPDLCSSCDAAPWCETRLEPRDACLEDAVKQFARGVRVLAAVGLLLASAPRPAAAMDPMAGTVRIAEMGRPVSPESCLGCARAAEPVACHRTALSLAMSHDW